MSLAHSFIALKKDKKFAKLILKYGELDNRAKRDPFVALARTIIYQQISGPAAETIFKRFKKLFPKGKKMSPKLVLELRPAALRAAGLSPQKVSYLTDLACKFSNGTIQKEKFQKMSSEEIMEHLLQIKGVGEWTVQMFLMHTMGRLDILPTKDLGIKKGMKLFFGLKNLPDEKTMERLALPWRAHATVASWYLWRLADEKFD